MELIHYLNKYFFTKQELLALAKISEQELQKHQTNRVMPKYSYKLNMNLTCDSFFGVFDDVQEIEYYAKGYVSWLSIIQSAKSVEAVYETFSRRYRLAIETLKHQGHLSNDLKVTSGLDDHIQEEWQHFLDGIYGLCTKTGLPEDIAAKELSIIIINDLSGLDELTSEQLNKLTNAVNLLDTASSLFAPHERIKSSRHRLVNEVRRQHKLNVS